MLQYSCLQGQDPFFTLALGRTDWNALYLFANDDNISWVDNRPCWNAQLSFLEMMAAVRAMMSERSTAGEDGSSILFNGVGFTQVECRSTPPCSVWHDTITCDIRL